MLHKMNKETIAWEDFAKIDLRVGTVTKAEIFSEVKKPAYKLWIDFGELGIKKTSAQITTLYTPETLINKQVIAVVNFEPKQIANFMSECLVLGTVDENNTVTLLTVEQKVINGFKVG
jgi:tRNA-binding protein